MATARYTFPIHCKVKVGGMVKFPCIVANFDSDAHAEAFRAYVEGKLSNEAKIGCNKTLQPVSEEELVAPASVDDTKDVKLLLGVTTDKDVTMSMRIPGVLLAENFQDLLTSAPGLQSPAGRAMDKIIYEHELGRNVIQGGNIQP